MMKTYAIKAFGLYPFPCFREGLKSTRALVRMRESLSMLNTLNTKQKIIWTDVSGKPVQPSTIGLAKQDTNGQLVTIVAPKPDYNKALTLCGECIL